MAELVRRLAPCALVEQVVDAGAPGGLGAREPGVKAQRRVDAAARFETTWGANLWTWRAGVDNLFDKRAWRESPYQFGHAYLYPLAPRTLRLSVQVDI